MKEPVNAPDPLFAALKGFKLLGDAVYEQLQQEEIIYLANLMLSWDPETRSAFADLKDPQLPTEMEARINRFAELLAKDAFTRGYMAGRMGLVPKE